MPIHHRASTASAFQLKRSSIETLVSADCSNTAQVEGASRGRIIVPVLVTEDRPIWF
ncbi:hypothetical protein [Bradyrhizobium cenepequi]|jgi:hypothetical protein